MKTSKRNSTWIGSRIIPAIIVIGSAAFAGMNTVSAQTLLLRYTFDESATGTDDAVDSGAAPAAPGTFMGAKRIGDTPGGHSKAAADFTGATATDLRFVTGGDAAKLDNLEAFTLTAWINVQDLPSGNRRIMAKQGGTPAFAGFSWNVNAPAEGDRTAANFGLRLFVGGDKGFQNDTTGPKVSIDADKKWVFVAISYDGKLEAENVMYYAGSVTDVVTNQVATTINAGRTTATDARFNLGHTDAALTSNTALPGWMDDVRVYSGILSTEQLNAVRLENLPNATGPRSVTLRNPKRLGTSFTFEFESQAGRNHRVESKNSLTDAAWQMVQTIAGTGSPLTATDAGATPNARFYRVVTE
jgi:hypothetical protein